MDVDHVPSPQPDNTEAMQATGVEAPNNANATVEPAAAAAPSAALHDYEAYQASRREVLRQTGQADGGGGGGGSRRRRHGSGHTHAPQQQQPWTAMPHRWVCVRLTLEETFFLQHVLGCLKVRVVVLDEADHVSQPSSAPEPQAGAAAAAAPVN